MTKPLGLIAGAGFGMAMIFFILAALLSPDSFRAMGYFQPAGEKPGQSSPGMQQWAWDGGDRLEIALPARVTLTQGGPPAIIVRGNRDALAKVRYGHGRLAGYNVYNCFIGFLCDDGRDERPLDVEVRGVALNEIDVSGVADVRLGHIEQDRLTLHISGAGAARGEGRLNSLDLSVSGAGHVGLAGLAVGSAKVVLSGAGSAEIAPSGSADVTISGVGSVRLATKPENLVTNISGMGSVTGPGIQRSRGHHHDQEEHVSNELDREIRDQVRAQIQAQNIPEKVKQKVEEKLKDTGLTAESPPVPPPPPR